MQTHTHTPRSNSAIDPSAYCAQPRVKYIFLSGYLKANRSAHVLHQQYLKAEKRTGWGKATPFKDALWDGFCALTTETEVCAKELAARGQLLYAFEGTTLLHGGAS